MPTSPEAPPHGDPDAQANSGAKPAIMPTTSLRTPNSKNTTATDGWTTDRKTRSKSRSSSKRDSSSRTTPTTPTHNRFDIFNTDEDGDATMNLDNNPAPNNVTPADEGAMKSPIKKKKKREVKAKSKQMNQAFTDAAVDDPSLLPPPHVKRSHAAKTTATDPAAPSADAPIHLTQEQRDANIAKTSARTAKNAARAERAEQKVLKAAAKAAAKQARSQARLDKKKNDADVSSTTSTAKTQITAKHAARLSQSNQDDSTEKTKSSKTKQKENDTLEKENTSKTRDQTKKAAKVDTSKTTSDETTYPTSDAEFYDYVETEHEPESDDETSKSNVELDELPIESQKTSQRKSSRKSKNGETIDDPMDLTNRKVADTEYYNSNKTDNQDDDKESDDEEEDDDQTQKKQQAPRRSSRKIPTRKPEDLVIPPTKNKRKTPANDTSIPVGESPEVSDTEMSANDITAENAEESHAVKDGEKENKEHTSDTEMSDKDKTEEQDSEEDDDDADDEYKHAKVPVYPAGVDHFFDKDTEFGTDELETHAVFSNWTLRFARLPKHARDVKLTKYESMAKWLGTALDACEVQHKSVKIEIHYGTKVLATTPTHSFELLLQAMSPREIDSLLNLPIPMQETQGTLSFNLFFHLTSPDNKSLLIYMENNLHDDTAISFTTQNMVEPQATKDIANTLENQKKKQEKLEHLCGAKTSRINYCRYSMRTDTYHLKKKVKRKKNSKAKTEEPFDEFILGCQGTAFDLLNSKLNGSLMFCRWRSEVNIAPLTADKTPFQKQFKTMAFVDLLKRFPRTRIREENQFVWADVLIAHNETDKDFNMVARDCLSDWKIDLFPKKLQDAEASTTLGWILWSSERVDPSLLQTDISRQIGFPVDVSPKRVLDGSDYGEKKAEALKKAWHIMVDIEHEVEAREKLRQVCTKRNPQNPLFGMQKLIPIYGSANTSVQQTFMIKATGRQFNFNAHAQTATTHSILNLDFPITSSSGRRVTLRQVISTFTRQDKPQASLFMDVGYSKNSRKSSVTFVFAPNVKPQAQLMVNSLLPYCRWLHGDAIAACFQPSAITDMAEVTWCPVTNQAISPMDNEFKLDDEADRQAGFDLDDIPDSEVKTGLLANTPSHLLDTSAAAKLTSQLMTGNDDVDTLGSYENILRGILPATAPTKSSDTIASDHTDDTTDTTKDKLARVEQLLAKMLGDDENSVDTTTLTKRQRMEKVTEHLQGLNLIPKATDKKQSSKAKKKKPEDKAADTEETKDDDSGSEASYDVSSSEADSSSESGTSSSDSSSSSSDSSDSSSSSESTSQSAVVDPPAPDSGQEKDDPGSAPPV